MREMDGGRVYRIGGSGGRYDITVCCSTSVGGRTVYLETSRDITSIFQEREAQFDTYTEWSIVLLLLSALVMLCLLYTSACQDFTESGYLALQRLDRSSNASRARSSVAAL